MNSESELVRPRVALEPIPTTRRDFEPTQDDVSLALTYIRKMVADAEPPKHDGPLTTPEWRQLLEGLTKFLDRSDHLLR